MGLIWFYDISTIVGYLMLNPLYIYIYIYIYIKYDFSTHFEDNIFKQA